MTIGELIFVAIIFSIILKMYRMHDAQKLKLQLDKLSSAVSKSDSNEKSAPAELAVAAPVVAPVVAAPAEVPPVVTPAVPAIDWDMLCAIPAYLRRNSQNITSIGSAMVQVVAAPAATNLHQSSPSTGVDMAMAEVLA